MRCNRYVPAISLAALALAAGCTSEKIVYRSGTDFAAPSAAAANFVGYYDVENKQTVCGSCHIDFQNRWQTTKHASAWQDLQSSGAAAGYCAACHTTNNLGNAATDTAAGYRSTGDARYHDVQCESCHGAGLSHASNPGSTNRPLASIRADTSLTTGCGECHSGVHNPFVAEWKASGHARTVETAHNSTDPYCQGCHTGQGALAAWGVTNSYAEKGAADVDVVCATCHDPHGSANSKQLRFSISDPSVENNLCMKCHQRRADPSQVTTRNSVHSPEGPTLLGTAGWFPPGMSTSDSIIGTHGTVGRNPKLCAGCHASRYTVTDKATGKFLFQSTGHQFLATPCVDANGVPTASQSCTVTAKSYRSCLGSGCHGSEAVARSAFNTAQARIALLNTQLTSLITQAKAGPKKTECNFPGPVYTTCNGATFNQSLSNAPASFVHNPFLIEQLLIASINQMKKDYSLTVSASVNLEPELTAPPGRGTR